LNQPLRIFITPEASFGMWLASRRPQGACLALPDGRVRKSEEVSYENCTRAHGGGVPFNEQSPDREIASPDKQPSTSCPTGNGTAGNDQRSPSYTTDRNAPGGLRTGE
jgi:hypothetical protein